MADFRSWDAYTTFESAVLRAERYFRTSEIDEFLKLVLDTSSIRQTVIPADHILWRAQQGHILQHDGENLPYLAPHSSERMKPLSHSAAEGRVNPKGISCLYLATDANTAMSEVRPWLGMYVSIGQFKTMRELRIIDCSVEHSESYTYYFDELPPEDRVRTVWQNIDRAFSEPVTANDMSADYAPTQVLAEYFKRNGFDGIIYKSLLGDGFNVALFDLTAADMIHCSLHIARKVSFQFEEAEAKIP